MITFERNDGGREAAGFKGETGDCVCRSIAIAAGKPYQEIYDQLFELGGKSPRNEVATHKPWFKRYMRDMGFAWVPTMSIGSGTKVHLRADELPKGRLVVRVTGHLTAVIDGILHDTHDCSRDGIRCVYGYWILGSGAAKRAA